MQQGLIVCTFRKELQIKLFFCDQTFVDQYFRDDVRRRERGYQQFLDREDSFLV